MQLKEKKGGSFSIISQPCLPVGKYIFTGEGRQSKRMKRDESNRVYWFQTRFLSLVYF